MEVDQISSKERTLKEEIGELMEQAANILKTGQSHKYPFLVKVEGLVREVKGLVVVREID